ncbi:MAG: RsmE family RNA methyltransferase [Spirochaetaceae bacterium]|nr:RsmE family RNA methyltransferase [Spirochaetaceae bacterium]
MNIVLFSAEEINLPLCRSDYRAVHILNILHKGVGDTFEAGIINGKEGIATITDLTEEKIIFKFTPISEGKKLYPLTMIIGFPRPIQLKRLLRDVASLGVASVHLTATELGEKSYLNSSMSQYENAYAMLKDGSVQAKSSHIPELFIHTSLKECLNSLTKVKNSLRVAFDNVKPESHLLALADFSQGCKAKLLDCGVVAAIGSERGWTDNERNMLVAADFKLCGIGSRVLRTETASTVAAALILSKMEV